MLGITKRHSAEQKMTVATLIFPILKSTLKIGPQAGIYGKKTQQISRMRVQRQRCPIICYIGQIFKAKIRMTTRENLLLSRFRKRICLETQADERSHHCVVHLYFFSHQPEYLNLIILAC